MLINTYLPYPGELGATSVIFVSNANANQANCHPMTSASRIELRYDGLDIINWRPELALANDVPYKTDLDVELGTPP